MAGRPPDNGESRDRYLRVRLGGYEQDLMDMARDGQTRSDYVRELIVEDARAKGLLE